MLINSQNSGKFHSITLDNTYYHLASDIKAWLVRNVSPDGCWVFTKNDRAGELPWTLSTMFGRITITFKDEEYLDLFEDRLTYLKTLT